MTLSSKPLAIYVDVDDTICKTNGMDNFEKIHFWRTPEARCGKAEECVPYSRWATDYVAVMGGR